MIDVFFIGDAADVQFGETVAWLRSHVCLREFGEIEAAQQAVRDEGPCPVVVLLGQSRRGQFSSEAIHRLLDAAPLARLVAIVGCWCEGETRSGAPLAGVHRVPWHAAARVVPRELASLAAARASAWSWPAGDEQVTAHPVAYSPSAGRLIVASSESLVAAESIAVALCDFGFSSVAVRPSEPISAFGVEAVVWDVPPASKRADFEWKGLQTWLPKVPVVALFNFPRPDDIGRLQSIGVAAVLGKPFHVADLAAMVQRLAADRQEVVSRQDIAAA